MAAQITIELDPPSRKSPATFSDKTDAFLSDIVTWTQQTNALATSVEQDADRSESKAAEATAQAVIATDQAVIATTQAGLSANSAAASAASANMTEWVSGTTYNAGDVVYSPINFKAYIRTTDGVGTIDPVSDNANWQLFLTGQPYSFTFYSSIGGI